MSILFNGQLVQEQELQIPLTNRAFQYNDGFFETMIVQKGSIRFWQDHVARMQEATAALKLQLSPELKDTNKLENNLLQLAEQNKALGYGRLKIKAWRSGGGIYTPETNNADWLATAQPTTPLATTPIHIGVCRSIHTIYTPLSHFKGPNSLIYVMAGIEKKERQLDDLLLLNSQKQVSELISANIFWIKHGVVYTPALETGCINGISRSNILRWCAERSIKVQETCLEAEKLETAEAVFAANVTGIRSIATIEKKQLITAHPILSEIQAKLFG